MKRICAMAMALLLICTAVASMGRYTGSSEGSGLDLNINAPEYINFTVTAENRHMIGYTGAAGEILNIPETFRDTDGKWYQVTAIGDDAFSWASNLTKVTIPDTVTKLGNSAFRFCSSLTHVSIPESVKSIGYCAFEECSSLVSVTLPSGLTAIDHYTFNSCDSLQKINLPSSVSVIGKGAFNYCKNLTGPLNLPSSLRYVFQYAFAHTNKITEIHFNSDIETIEWDAFYTDTMVQTTITGANTVVQAYDWQASNRLVDSFDVPTT